MKAKYLTGIIIILLISASSMKAQVNEGNSYRTDKIETKESLDGFLLHFCRSIEDNIVETL